MVKRRQNKEKIRQIPKKSTPKIKLRGLHYKTKGKKDSTITFDKISLRSNTKMPRNGWKNAYFSSAFFVTIMLAVLAIGLLFVDSRTHSFGWGTQNTALAFSSQSKGIAQLTLMGKHITLDMSSLNPIANVLSNLSGHYLSAEPALFKGFRMMITAIWQCLTQLGAWIVSLL